MNYTIPKNTCMYVSDITRHVDGSTSLTSCPQPEKGASTFHSVREVTFSDGDIVDYSLREILVFKLPLNEYGPYLVVSQRHVIES